MICSLFCFFVFFQAEDGIRDFHVTGVQTCALPILGAWPWWRGHAVAGGGWGGLRGGWRAAVEAAAGWWGQGGLAAGRVAAKVPAALVDRTVMGSAQHDQ